MPESRSQRHTIIPEAGSQAAGRLLRCSSPAGEHGHRARKRGPGPPGRSTRQHRDAEPGDRPGYLLARDGRPFFRPFRLAGGQGSSVHGDQRLAGSCILSRMVARPCTCSPHPCSATRASSGSATCSTGKDSPGPRKSRHSGRLPARAPQQRPEIHRRRAAGHQRARTGWRLRNPGRRRGAPGSGPRVAAARPASTAGQGAATRRKVGGGRTRCQHLRGLPHPRARDRRAAARRRPEPGPYQSAGPAVDNRPGAGLPRLASRLLGEVTDDRRRLILTSRTFAPQRRTYDSLAAESGVSRGRVQQLETSALQQLAQAAMEDQYAPLRWRAASAARVGAVAAAEGPGAPPWMRRLLSPCQCCGRCSGRQGRQGDVPGN